MKQFFFFLMCIYVLLLAKFVSSIQLVFFVINAKILHSKDKNREINNV